MPAFGEASPEDRTLVYDAAVAFDGEQRLISRRFVSGYPLVVVVSRTLRSVLGDWRSQSILTVITSTLAVLAVLVVMAALARQFSAYEALARAVRDREQAIAAREQAEAQLRQSQKLEAMGQLTSGVAHDFNNFLTVVIGNLELIARRLPSGDDPIRRLADGALAGAARAAGLTKRLLAFSRRQELAPQPVDVNELVEGMADILRHTLGRITLTLELAPGLPQIFADPNQLESALLNLVVNARDAMPDGGCVTVHTRAMPVAENEPAAIEVVVADAGTGMSEDVARQAFEPFFTTKPPGQGTGLGLAQVHDFVVQAEGEVKVDSVVGQGTRIHMRLPAWRAEGRVAART
jgi:signal transduction histidine kinase